MRKKIADINGIRTCNKCLKEYPLDKNYFHHDNKNTPNFFSICKFCNNKIRRERWLKKLSHNHKKICKKCGSFFWAALLQINKARRAGRKDVFYCSKICRNSRAWSWQGKRKGSNNPNCKLNEEKVRQIKSKILLGQKPSTLSEEFNISKRVIYSIKKGIAWKHVEI